MKKKSTHTLFCDETGNTGNRFLDLDQPVYAEGGWVVANRSRIQAAEAILDIERQFNFGSKELKGADLVRKPKGQLSMRKACEAIGKNRGFSFIYIVEKRYAVCTKIVETYFDPDYNPLIPVSDTWDPEKRQSDAQFFYKRDGTLIDQFAEGCRQMDPDALETNVRNYVTLLNACGMTDQAMRVAGVLPNIRDAIRIDSNHLKSGAFPTGMDSLNLPIISEVFQFVEKTCPFPADIVHDQVASYEPLYRYIFEHFKKVKPVALEMKDGRRFHVGFENVLSLSFADSKTEPLIRAADYALAGVRKFIQFALSDEPISENLTLIAFYMIGPLVLGAHERFYNSKQTMPYLAHVMASADWVAKVFRRLITEMKLLPRNDLDRTL